MPHANPHDTPADSAICATAPLSPTTPPPCGGDVAPAHASSPAPAPALRDAGEAAFPSAITPRGALRLADLRLALRYDAGRGLYVAGPLIAPEDGERRRMRSRARRIRAALEPAGETAAARSILRLQASLRPRALAGPPEMAELAAADALRAFAALPAGALAEATQRYVDGREGRGGWCPEPAQVAATAREIAGRWAEEAATLERAAECLVDDAAAAPDGPADETPGARAARRAELARTVRQAFAPYPVASHVTLCAPASAAPAAAHLAHAEALARLPTPTLSAAAMRTLEARR